MKKNTIIVILIIITIVMFVVYKKPVTENPISVSDPVTITNEPESIVGCYAATLKQDIYTLSVTLQTGDAVQGNLEFKNFEKDSSVGTFAGTYVDGILLADYTFNSEGSESVMKVAFKKTDDGFVRGYGETTADGLGFVNPGTITYDDTVLYRNNSVCNP